MDQIMGQFKLNRFNGATGYAHGEAPIHGER